MKSITSDESNDKNGDILQVHQRSSQNQTHQQQFANNTNSNTRATMSLPETLPSIEAPQAALSTAAAVAAVSSAVAVANTTQQPLNHPAIAVNNNNKLLTNNNGVTSNLPVLPKPPPSSATQVAMPQHLINSLYLPAIYYQPQQPHQTKAVPDVFEKMALRRGKWTPEEERFANVLIEEFEKGTIRDCENGCTLRAFLSRKLHCAPMRISKKYAGKSIGKHVFLSRASAPDNHEKLKQLEYNFHVSLVREDTSGEDSIALKLLSSTNYSNTPTLHGMPPHGYQMQVSQPNFLNNSQAQIPPQTVARAQYRGGMTIGANIQPTSSRPSQPQLWQMPNVNTKLSERNHSIVSKSDTQEGSSDNAMRLQQNLFKVFKEAQTETYKNSSSTLASTPVQSNNDISQSQPSNQIQEKENNTDQWNSTDALLTKPSEDIPELLSGFENINSKLRNNMSDKKSDLPHNNIEHNWFPDALAANTLSTTVANNLPVGQFSPTFTSKSFDDLHQYLGKEYPPSVQHPFQSSKAADSSVDKLGMPIYTIHDNGAASSVPSIVDDSVVSPDAYALFAEQSAIEVSKHSAYCRTDTTIVPSSNQASLSQQQNQENSCNNEVQMESVLFRGTNNNSPSIRASLDNDHSAAFITANLKLHSKAVEERDIADQAAKGGNSKGNLNVHSGVVSASEKSSSEMGSAVSSSRTASSCASSGSDNASENSDSASDEGCPNNIKKRKLENGSSQSASEPKLPKLAATLLQQRDQ